MVQHCPFKTHNTLNPFINRSTSNDGWAFSPQAAISPVCTQTGDQKKKKIPLIQVLKGVAGHSQSSHAYQIYCGLGQESQTKCLKASGSIWLRKHRCVMQRRMRWTKCDGQMCTSEGSFANKSSVNSK